jgi:hypothetical protein
MESQMDNIAQCGDPGTDGVHQGEGLSAESSMPNLLRSFAIVLASRATELGTASNLAYQLRSKVLLKDCVVTPPTVG